MSAMIPGTSAVLHQLFSSSLAALGKSALMLPEGNTLFTSQGLAAADIATLPQAAAICHRYLNLQDGDLAISNDPMSGGTTLSEFTLVIGVVLKPPGTKTKKLPEIPLLLARRISFASPFPVDMREPSKVDNEGVRVPPTPISGKDKSLNKDLLTAIASHPMAPAGFFDRCSAAFSELQTAAAGLRRLASVPGSLFTREHFEAYIEDSSRVFDMLMTRLPLGTAIVSHVFPTGEVLKLKLSVTEDHVIFDFTGTEPSGRYALTELATFSACFAATASAFGANLPMNAGSFQHVQISTPLKTIVSAPPGLGTHRGMTEGVAAVCRLARKAFAQLNQNFRVAESADLCGNYQLVFGENRRLDLSTPPGSAATAISHGSDGGTPWAPTTLILQQLSSIETAFPLTFIAAGTRAESGGKGKTRGGNGTRIHLRIEQPCEFRWLDTNLQNSFAGIDGAHAGQQGSLQVFQKGDWVHIETTSGSMNLDTGAEIHIQSAGGGGFGASGKPKDSSESE